MLQNGGHMLGGKRSTLKNHNFIFKYIDFFEKITTFWENHNFLNKLFKPTIYFFSKLFFSLHKNFLYVKVSKTKSTLLGFFFFVVIFCLYFCYLCLLCLWVYLLIKMNNYCMVKCSIDSKKYFPWNPNLVLFCWLGAKTK